MSLMKKATVSSLAVSMAIAALGALPLSPQGAAGKLGVIQAASAASAPFSSAEFVERMNGIYAALQAGDPADVQDVRNLRDEIAKLNPAADASLLDPVWDKIAAKLPESADAAALKTNLFSMIQAAGSIRYDSGASDLEAIRTNPQFRATLKAIAAAGGDSGITMDDFIVFLFGDGGSRDGIEGNIRAAVSKLSSYELLSLLSSNDKITALLTQALAKQLAQTDQYKFSAILGHLGVTAQDAASAIRNFQNKLQYDVPAINALAVAYVRSEAEAAAAVSEDGLQQKFSLKVLGISIPSVALQWSKVSGSDDVTVKPDGTVSIPPDVERASAVIQAKVLNPYGGSPKVIFQQEVTLQAAASASFPVQSFLTRMAKLQASLMQGDAADIQAVKNLRDELAKLSPAQVSKLLSPVWTPISSKLPASVDKEQLKLALSGMVAAAGAVAINPTEDSVKALLGNEAFRTAVQTIGAAGGVKRLTVDDLLVFCFGDGDQLGGVAGKVRDEVASSSQQELAQLILGGADATGLVQEAAADVLGDHHYKVSEALANLGVKASDLRASADAVQQSLKYDKPAAQALAAAYIRTQIQANVKVSQKGKQQDYSLILFDKPLPSGLVEWSKVSGDAGVKVSSSGKVTLAKGVSGGKAVIQAALRGSAWTPGKTIFRQEITIGDDYGNGGEQPGLDAVLDGYNTVMNGIKAELAKAKTIQEQLGVVLKAVQASKDAVEQVNGLTISASAKVKASSEIVARLASVIGSAILGKF
ncbi:hypothetical protein [Paenibacillus protaetiae]|uniref:Uncharacterized protein n=1 Tax=Paenibacillus protaetiae TaxID=2509456 RepID=A0A4P6EW12_9BACL|nr:hypothetical protein [Paenibacillus protaetiae]QAY67204.1 hypothetical protein ET464_13145 [Paenibacillus protaetiae]